MDVMINIDVPLLIGKMDACSHNGKDYHSAY
jgi:hypothetical protein